MARFRLFGFPVEVRPTFLLTAGLIGYAAAEEWLHALLFAAVLLVSVLVHELGHAAMASIFGQRPRIILHALGGLTAWSNARPIARKRQIFVSLAGPGAGLLLGAVAFGLLQTATPETPLFTLWLFLVIVNVGLSALNLVPVLPFDGGQVLVATLGPRRRSVALGLSLLFGLALAVAFLRIGWVLAALVIASSAVMSFFGAHRRELSAPSPTALKTALEHARRSLSEDAYDQASAIARAVVDAAPEPSIRRSALEVAAWAALLGGDSKGALETLRMVPAPESDRVEPYLAGAVLEANGRYERAIAALERARAAGDERPELAGLLVRALLGAGRFDRAADLTGEILDEVDDAEARRVASEAHAGAASGPAARLFARLFERTGRPADALSAARGFARAGGADEALEWLRRAVDAGLPDPASVLDDPALATLREDERFLVALRK